MWRSGESVLAMFYATTLLALVPTCHAATFVVTNTLSSGPGSFYQALSDAASNPGVDVITFSNVTGQITAGNTFADTIILGPGARQLTLVGAGIVIDSGRSATISGLRIAPASDLGFQRYGGIISNHGTLFLQNCELVGARQTLGQGAAIYNAGDLTISGCTIANNQIQSTGVVYPIGSCGAGQGAGLYVASGAVSVNNSTFSGNAAWTFSIDYVVCNGKGGAAYVESGSLLCINCTFALNYAAEGGAIYNYGGAVDLRNCIVTDGPVAYRGALSGNTLFTNVQAVGLGPLQDNGGPTLTHGLASNSIAINRGTSSGAPPTDQRGVTRPQGSGVDLGAFEFERGSNYFQFDLAAVGPGTVSRSPDAVFVPSNTVVVVTANSAEDYGLVGWTGDATGKENPLLVTIDRDKSIIGTFQYAPSTVINPPWATNYVNNTNGWGLGSFRQAIRNVNASGGGTIRFSNMTGSIALPLGLPPIQANVRIFGPGQSNLSLKFPSGVEPLVFPPRVTGTLSGMTISSPQPRIRWGGAISNAGNLILNRVSFVGCSSSNGGAVFNSGRIAADGCSFVGNYASSGGAIYNRGGLLVNNSSLLGNQSLADGYDNYGGGGAVYNESGNAFFSRCVLNANNAGGSMIGLSAGPAKGGAIYQRRGSTALLESMVSSNSTSGASGLTDFLGHNGGSGGSAVGAAIYLDDGAVALTNCALAYNRGTAGDAPFATRYIGGGGTATGGGIYVKTGQLYAINCTISSNQIRSGITGGGGYGLDPGGGRNSFGAGLALDSGTGTLANCTVTGNRAVGGNAAGMYGTNWGRGLGGGITTSGLSAMYYYLTGSIAVVSTIVSGNFGALLGTNGVVADDLYGPGLSLGHNLVGSGSNFARLSSDLISVDPRLGPLRDNGGTTPTHALLAGSPAIDAGAPALLTFDQRGQPRTVDNTAVPNWMGSDGTDIGALEVNDVLILTGVSLDGTDTQLKFTTVSDRSYRLQFRSNGTQGQWVTLPDIIIGTGGIVTATNIGGALFPSRIYRAYRQ